MNLKTKRIIGSIIVVLFFGSLLGVMIYAIGWKAVLVFVGAVVIAIVLVMGCSLAFDPEDKMPF